MKMEKSGKTRIYDNFVSVIEQTLLPVPGFDTGTFRQFFRKSFFLGGWDRSAGTLGHGGEVDFAMSGVCGGHASFEFVCDLNDIKHVDSVVDLDFLGVEANSCHGLPFSKKK
ncbi:hypothetical protein [Noviherbaspirillum malthae]|uniref:hypothetical protein n=1 Tax=Noviherbaspirillum malthae TaxID=1260987 RepID=UPI00188F6B11|nr:hypothetical protein [Noviherbaspirillum malthae]